MRMSKSFLLFSWVNLKPGVGDLPKASALLHVKYTGYTENGTEFLPETTLTFKLGSEDVIQGTVFLISFLVFIFCCAQLCSNAQRTRESLCRISALSGLRPASVVQEKQSYAVRIENRKISMGMLRMHARVSATHNSLTFCCLSCAEVSKPIDLAQEPKRKRKEPMQAR